MMFMPNLRDILSVANETVMLVITIMSALDWDGAVQVVQATMVILSLQLTSIVTGMTVVAIVPTPRPSLCVQL